MPDGCLGEIEVFESELDVAVYALAQPNGIQLPVGAFQILPL